MSNVLVRHRSISELEFIAMRANCANINALCHERKRTCRNGYKFVFAVPMVNLY